MAATPHDEVVVLAGILGGPGCADGVGADGRLSFPEGLARGSDGQLYVATGCGTIRRFDPTTGALTTIAGNPLPQYAGTTVDGKGTAAHIYDPQGLEADAYGNLFVAEGQGHCVRKLVLATGDVTTVAGNPSKTGAADGTGSQALFTYPMGIVTDGAGSLYVTDTTNHDLRKINITTGQVVTVGGPAVPLSNPRGMAFDVAGHRLYIADGGAAGNIFLVDFVATTAPALVFTGTAAPLTSPIGLTLDGAGHLLMTDADVVREVDLTTNQLTDVAGARYATDFRDDMGSAARFSTPTFMLSDGPGRAYVSDSANGLIRAVDTTTGAVTTVAGRGARFGYQDGTGAGAELGDVTFIYSDGQGSLYNTDSGFNTVRKIVLATGEVTTIAGHASSLGGSADGIGAAALFSSPMGVTGDGAGNLYVADSGNDAIRRIVLATGEVSTIAGGKIGTMDGVGKAAQLNTPYGITCDGANLYFVDQQGNEIRKMDLTTGQVTTLAGTPYTAGWADGVGSAARFNQARNLVYDGSGHLYIVEKNNNSIRRLDLATNQVTGYVPPAPNGFANGPVATAHFDSPYDIATDGAGHLYIADADNSLIRRVDLSTGTVSTAVGVYTGGYSGILLGSPSTTRLNLPRSLAVLPGGSGVVFADERALLIAWF